MPTAVQPYLGTDAVGAVIAYLAVLYYSLSTRDREPGMGWFSAGAVAMALWVIPTGRLGEAGAGLNIGWWWVPLIVGLACYCIGVVQYMGVPAAWRRRVTLVLTIPLVITSAARVMAFITGNPPVPVIVTLLPTMCFIGQCAVVLWAWRREPDVGHGLIALAMFAVPVVGVFAYLHDPTVNMVRYWAILPGLAFFLTLLVVSLLRRRHSLDGEIQRRRLAEAELLDLNTRLESEVVQRTRDLRDMVAGLESFSRSVSHDLRGPLGGIGQLARLAEEALARGDNPGAARLLRPIAVQAETSARLVDALLALARASDGPLKLQPVNLDELARDVAAAALRNQATAGTASMPLIEIAALPQAIGDPDLCRAVLNNLIGNAVKFSKGRQGARIQIDAANESGFVSVHVRDNGVGFDDIAAARLFQPFGRLHAQAFEGHGLGLSIVRRAVERLGGTVHAEGRPGGGATFSFTLPVAA